jgi:hypothetical protein
MLDPTSITLIGSVASLIIGSIVTGIVTIIKAINDNKKIVQEVITPKLDKIEILVNGRYNQVLQELADVKKQLAIESGKVVDFIKAGEAQKNADEHSANIVEASKIK